MGSLAGVVQWAGRAGSLAIKHGGPLHSRPLLKCCCRGSAGADSGKFFNSGARDADGGEMAAQGAQASVVTALFKGEGFKEGMARQPAFRQASEAGEKAGGEAVPGEGEGRAAEFSIGGGIQGGGVHASDAAQESAVECFGSSGGFGSAWGKGPDLTGIGEDRGDEGVKETAKSGRGGDVELGAAPVQGMQGALASRVEVGGGGGDALFGVEGNAQVTIGVGGGESDR